MSASRTVATSLPWGASEHGPMLDNRPGSQRTALVIGATGGAGAAVARALSGRGWRIKALHRRPEQAPAGATGTALEWVKDDAMQGADVVAAAQGASLIFHGANPPGYRRWGARNSDAAKCHRRRPGERRPPDISRKRLQFRSGRLGADRRTLAAEPDYAQRRGAGRDGAHAGRARRAGPA